MLTMSIPESSASAPPSRVDGGSESLSLSARLLTRVARQCSPSVLHVKEMEEQLAELRTSLILAFNPLFDLKDLNTGVHSTRLAEWALHVAGELGLDSECLADIEVQARVQQLGDHYEQPRQTNC